MEKFILIIALSGSGNGNATEITGASWPTKEKCKAAAVEMLNDMQYVSGNQPRMLQVNQFSCLRVENF
ncbi:hypothetical protein FDI40_gp160 [Agrobacterium phage Atu_ph07]|uniref:Uncharacterized protein n=1 Tax=Agrobacterium phage Atu_ph07 TaxID=2024264 RepID=A0A2L0UZF6_9CAUD|nr:hypothetical protein FDI40_gp160 [Agrobacterium phage Atu_ph07]AUZ94942.1 hypothetical protein [Agrobacterium phage Atu_ph07]